ncbi:hypothetical protein SLEP1_g46792 [Rubroshorea leprosula]|uniref:BZIP domain-containing protein n=1 Tax=Rubroshorea leprosula TaxID=152421 RepID=A0AAV5LND8_9ROSI|nr:hypothetical protein SLEP1_g46792 [Rubroshorea leprosula]
MVAADSELGEVESPLQPDQQQNRNHPISSLGRQSSIYSLTLDEFQHTLCESSRNFGAMNMDEFLTSIWNAEENQAINSTTTNNPNNQVVNHGNLSLNETPNNKDIAKQHSLSRQGSLTLPAPLCRKTVDEVWSEIHRGQQGQEQGSSSNVQNPENAQRQPTFGEMNLEDFLIKAGVVREQCLPPAPPSQQQQPHYYELYLTANNPAMAQNFVSNRPVMGMGSGGPYQTMPPVGKIGESSVFVNNTKKSGYPQINAPPPPQPVCYNGRLRNGGAYGVPGQSMGMVPPVSPVSSDSVCAGQVDGTAMQFGMVMNGPRGRKRIIDGTVEKVVERRQRRMIKNRESAARSRARKQAYTVELEAELNQLKQENTHLKQALADLEQKKKHQCFEEGKMKAQTKSQKAREKLRVMRRNLSCPL